MSTTPLLVQNTLGNNILALFEGANEPDTRCKKMAKASLNGLSVVLVLSNKLPFIPIALSVPYVGFPVAVGTIVGFGTLEFWAFKATTEPFVETEKQGLVPISKSSQTIRKAAIVGSSYIIALGAQIPISLSAAKYDPPSLKIAGFLVSEVVGAFIPALSLKMAFEQNLPRKYKDAVEQKLYKAYLNAKELVASNHQLLIDMGYAEQLQFIQAIDTIKTGQNNDAQKISAYAQKLLSDERHIAADTCCKKGFSYPVKLTGIVLATSFLYASARYSYDVSQQELYNNVATGAAFAAVGVLSNAFIMYAALNETLMKAYNSAYSFLNGSYTPSLADQINPRLSFALKAGFFVADGLGIGIIYKIWNDYFGDQLEQDYFITTNCLSLFLLLFTAALDTTDDIVYMMQKNPNPNDYRLKLIELNSVFKKIKDQLLNCPLDKFAIFLNALPDALKEQLINRVALTQQELSSYLDRPAPVDV